MADRDGSGTAGDDTTGRSPAVGMPPPEGIRIIGAKEASEAAREAETGVQPAVASVEAPRADEFGAVPVIRAGEPPEELIAELPAVDAHESFELPHYSEPPTGQVPKVVIGDESDASWAALSDAPRWRDSDHKFTETADITELVDDGPKLGALDPDRPARFFEDEDLSVATTTGSVPQVRRVSDRAADADADADVPPFEDDGEDREEHGGAPVRRPPRPRRRPQRDGLAIGAASGNEAGGGGRNLPMAIGVGLTLVGIGFLCFWLGSFASMILVGVVLGLCAIEFFDALRRGGYQPASLLGIVGVLALAVAPLYRGFFAYPIVLGLVTLAGLAWFLFVQPGEGAIMNLGATLLGVLYIGGLGGFATLTMGVGRHLEVGDNTNQGIGVVIAAVMVTVCYDVGAYFIGRAVGQTPLSQTSPNKTKEGLFGGVAVGVFLPFLILWLADWAPVGVTASKAFAFCLFCALMAPLGDLCESALKRDLGIKDMGTLLPGHGGVLDRFDGLLFVLPTAYFMAHVLDLGSNLSFGP